MPEQDFALLDERFRPCVKTSAGLEKIWTGGRWTEGPAYFPASKSLVWSDIPNDRIMRWDETTGAAGVFRGGLSCYTNGNSVDRQGRLISCEHGSRRVTRTEHDGSITIIADSYQGKRLNSPNDVVVRSDGTIWFTDPAYGIDSDYEGFHAPSELGHCYVFCADPRSATLRIVADDFVRPNGLAFSVDESVLYIVDSGASHRPDGPRHMRSFQVAPDGKLSGGAVFATCENGVFDGFRVDTADRIWTSAADGVHCYHADGTLIGKIFVPERVSNLCFGGQKRNRMFITASTSVYSVMLPVNGSKTF